MEIITPRLKLRLARMDDLEPIHAVLSNHDAMRWWSTLPHTEIAQTRAWLESLGFVQTGQANATIRVGGQWMDSLYYGLERSGWSSPVKG